MLLSILFSLVVQGAFEAIDCGQEDIFENPSYIISNQGLQTLWVQSFGILPYARIGYSGIGNFGIGGGSFGNELYRETEILLGYSWSKEEVKLGVSVRGMNLWVKDRDTDFAIGVDFGVSFQVTPSFDFNLALHNINFPKIGNDELPKRAIAGFITKLTPEVTTWFQVYKESIYPVEIRIRNEIRISELMSLGVGVKTYPSSFSFGVLLNYKRLGISYFARTHETLGLTHILGVKIRTV